MTVPQTRDQLIDKLQHQPKDADIPGLVGAMEAEQAADLNKDIALLAGVWELRWSSSTQPWLKQAPWLDNLQVLDPERGRGCNLLRLRGPLAAMAGISVQADIRQLDNQRVEVLFRRGGWVGPQLPGGNRLQLLREVQQSFPAWLDITVLDRQLRICRGNAGTTFALLRRDDLNLEEFFDSRVEQADA